MEWSAVFFLNSIMLGIGLAMDAFSVSLANGLNEARMKKGRMCLMAGVFSGFQFIMPMIGWFCVHTFVHYFTAFEKFIPWIALVLLCYTGGKMLIEGIKCGDCEECEGAVVSFTGLIIQGIATSIDALSVGFTIADYNSVMAFVCCMLIGAVTFFICFAGVALGKKVGTRLTGKASVFGGIILIVIGFEIFITGVM